jgi:peptidyl-prolyl cis-trans isomerase SurA
MKGRIPGATLLLALILLVINSCSSLKGNTERGDAMVVGEVAGEKVTWQELKQNYQRNPLESDPDAPLDIDDITGFLDLYLDYRAKLAAARDAGYFEDESIHSELNQYEMQSVYPYWMENKIREELLQELFERSSEQIRASHILIRVDQNPSPRDTLAAWNRLMEARERFEAGEDFDELSMEYSSTDRGRSMGGDIGFFSAGRTVKEFEDAAYATAVNEVSMPFRTQFGYHMLYVKERREREPEKMYSHIFFQQREPIEEVLEIAGQARSLLDEGTSWPEVVRQFSEDQSSVARNGQIGWIQPGQYAAVFDSTIMTLVNPGDITPVFRSEYGVHIVKLDSIRTYENDEVLRAELMDVLRQLPRYRNTRNAALEQVKAASNARIHNESRSIISEMVSSTAGVSFENLTWPDGFREKPFFTIEGKTYTVADYFDWLDKRWEQNQTRIYQHGFADEFANAMAEENVLDITKRVFPEFARLSEQYLDGLVVFKITEDSVWNYAAIDTASLQDLYNENPDRYRFDRRYEFYRFSAAQDSTINRGVEMYNSGVPVDSLIGKIQGLTIRRDIVSTLDEHPLTLLADLNEGEFSELFTHRARRNRLLLEKIHEPRQMSFEEAYHRLVSDYQPIREEQWMQAMRQQYNVTPFPERIPEFAAQSR